MAGGATSRVYLGPATTFNDKPVPAGGLKVSLTDDQVRQLVARGHVFDGKGGDILRVADLTGAAAPTPAADKT